MKHTIYKNYIKRLLDIILSSIALVLLSPVLLIVGILIRIKLGTPILFKQERPGLNNKIFTLYKFRTMTDQKDSSGHLLSDDIRLTTFGQILRTLSIDELPELINIFKGDMSFIGPRPLLVQYLPLYNDRQIHRHDVLPGISGYAQVHGRNSISWEEKFEYDLYYVEHISLMLDIKILLQTILVVIKHDGIHSDTSGTMEEFKGTKDE